MLVIGMIAQEPSRQFDFLVLDRDHARVWPWLTAHFLHTDSSHLGWNLLAFASLGWLGEAEGRLRFITALAVGIIAVDVWFAFFAADIRLYCGLSGALNTVLLVTLYGLRGAIPTLWLIAFAAAVAAKIAWESHTGVALFTHTRWPSATGAHVAGYAAGIAMVAVLAVSDRLCKNARVRAL